MKRVKCIIAYDGTNFQGYQSQPNKRTVQGEIEKVLKKLHKGRDISIHASGRTDARVHAMGQVIHFDSDIPMAGERWVYALNSLLPGDISVREARYVDADFHARFSCIGKEYRYRIDRRKIKNPFLRNYAYHYTYPLNMDELRRAMSFFIGTHDFTSFCSAKTEVVDKVRTVTLFDVEERDKELIFRIAGNGFLYNMVRIIIGTVLEAGAGKRTADEIPEILKAKDRTRAGKTVPGHGLYLWEVYY